MCEFEAFIDDKIIVGVVKEKSAAKRAYKEAVQRGDGAYLMEQNEEQPGARCCCCSLCVVCAQRAVCAQTCSRSRSATSRLERSF